jgi:hypothetical protein
LWFHTSKERGVYPQCLTNFSGVCFERQMCGAKWVLSKKRATYLHHVWSLTREEVQLGEFSWASLLWQSDSLSAHHKLFTWCGRPSIYLCRLLVQGYLGPPSLAVFLHKPSKWKPMPLFFVHIWHQVSIFLLSI